MNQQKEGFESLKFLTSLKNTRSDHPYGWCLIATSRRCPPWTPTMRKFQNVDQFLGGIFTMKQQRWPHASNDTCQILGKWVAIQPIILSTSSYWSYEKKYSSKDPDFLCFLHCRPFPLAPWPSKSPRICTQRCYIHHLQLPKDSLDCNMGASPRQKIHFCHSQDWKDKQGSVN